ncbi:MAG: DUF177 domain-containing protein [Desulfomonile tiedjei]|nr:DUF177 domain-containing protein [Desulfomonile tiedjei]
MKIRFDDIPEEGLELELSEEKDSLSHALESIPPTEGIRIDPRVKGHLQILVSAKDYFLLGTVQGIMHLQCSRCLVDFSLERQIDLNMVFRHRVESVSERESDEADKDIVYIDGPEIELAEIILQEILLEAPMKPLCREDCPGLCPRCGALKGSPECTCPREAPVDPRWNALAKLKKGLAS